MDSNEQQAIGDSSNTAGSSALRKTLCEYLVDVGKLNRGNVERACRLQHEQEQ